MHFSQPEFLSGQETEQIPGGFIAQHPKISHTMSWAMFSALPVCCGRASEAAHESAWLRVQLPGSPVLVLATRTHPSCSSARLWVQGQEFPTIFGGRKYGRRSSVT